MRASKLILASAAAFVVTFSLSWFWHLQLLGDFYASRSVAVARPEPDMVMVTLGQLILAGLMAWVYPMGYKGGAPITEGARFGAIIGLLWILPWSVIISGIWDMAFSTILVDAAWHVIEEGLGGIAVGLVYGRMSQPGGD